MEHGIYISDWDSYNNELSGICGRWYDIDKYSSKEELLEAVHHDWKLWDITHPLDNPREELMVQDTDGLIDYFTDKEGAFDEMFSFYDLCVDDQIKVAVFLEKSYSFDYAMANYDSLCLIHIGYMKNVDKYRLFEEYYPEAEVMENNNPYVGIDYDQFIEDYFYEFEFEGEIYWFEENGFR